MNSDEPHRQLTTIIVATHACIYPLPDWTFTDTNSSPTRTATKNFRPLRDSKHAAVLQAMATWALAILR